MPKPKKALLRKTLATVDKDSSVAVGHNKVSAVTLVDDSEIRRGFFKQVDENYTEERCKYVILSSILMRFTLDRGAAEERLVFDEIPNGNGPPTLKICGTVSMAIPGFRNMAFNDTPLPHDDIKRREELAPSHQTLLKYNAAAALLNRHRRKCDDLYPGNFGWGHTDTGESFIASIDYDRCEEQGSARNAAGYFLGTPREKAPFNPRFFDNFPNETGRFYFPTNATATTFKPNRKFPLHGEFVRLAKEPLFHKQMMSAALLELLVHRPTVIKRQLQEYLGETDPFIETIMPDIQRDYDEFYRAVVFYDGCIRNKQGQFVPSFEEFLSSTPSAFQQAMARIKEYNQQMLTLYKDDAADFLMNESEVEQHYHQIWRDAHVPALNQVNTQLKFLMGNLEQKLKHSDIITSVRDDTSVEFTQAVSAQQVLQSFNIDDDSSFIDQHSQHALVQSWIRLKKFKSSLDLAIHNYVDLDRKQLNAEANDQFNNALFQLNRDKDGIARLLGQCTSLQGAYQEIRRHFSSLIVSMNWMDHRNGTDRAFKAPNSDQPFTVYASHVEPAVVQSCMEHLSKWVDGLSNSAFKGYLNNIIDKQYSPFLQATSRRTRSDEVKNFLETSPESHSRQLESIFGQRGVEESSLNTLILKDLIPKMLAGKQSTVDENLEAARYALEDEQQAFNWKHYAQEAQRMANESAQSTSSLISKKMFEWVDTMGALFHSRVKDQVFPNYKTTWGMFWSDRKVEINTMFANSQQNPNARILAKMIDGSQESNSLSTIAIKFFMRELIAEARKESYAEDPDWQRIARINPENHNFYAPLLKVKAQLKLAQYERSLVQLESSFQ